MKSHKDIGRVVGLVLLLHLVLGLMVPFIIIDRIRQSASLITNAAAHPGALRGAVLLLFLGSALAITATVLAWPVIRRYSAGMRLWLFALGVVAFCLQAVDNSALLSLLSMSQQYAQADATKIGVLEAIAPLVGSMRRWTHYSALLFAVSWIFLLFMVLYRYRLVPRVLSALGMAASLLQISAVSLRGLLGYPPETRLAVPLAPVYVALALWLLAKGFNEPREMIYANEGAGKGASG